MGSVPDHFKKANVKASHADLFGLPVHTRSQVLNARVHITLYSTEHTYQKYRKNKGQGKKDN